MSGDEPGYRTGNLAEANNEAGAMDNIIKLNPNDDRWKDTVGEWKDGEKYTFTKVEVEQVSPGNFKVLSAHTEGMHGDDVNAEANERAAEKTGGDEDMNPAVENLIASGERK